MAFDLLRDFDKAQIAKKQRTTTETTLSKLDSVLASLSSARAALVGVDVSGSARDGAVVLAPGGGGPVGLEGEALVRAVPSATKAAQASVLDAHKDLHAAVAKYAKAVDKRFKADLDDIWDPRALDGRATTLAFAIVAHLVREGRFDIARSFATEAMLNNASAHDALSAQFADMYTILSAIRAFDLAPAIAWVDAHTAKLKDLDSTLAFSVVRLQFLKLLFGIAGVSVGDRDAALEYAKAKFEPFKDRNMKEISRLMCSLAFTSKIAASPYKDLTSPTAWSDLAHAFTRDFCLLLHLPAESPLHTCVSVGISALPTIIKMSGIMKEQSGLEWSSQGELPVEIPLLDRQRFHSVFACPVSKELGTKENPPMMMVCGHVVSKESLQRLGKGSMTAKFKCPYCPSEGKGEQAIQVYF
ncbi:CTLH/CRA C-terminal to lish motif domain-containing protein [Chytriomyces sp. MP71]|nr:CTLH/CRA C-terminal to lish motif domain-containing protein [Chytriomyces sp. MP71]